MAAPTIALLVQPDPTNRRETAARLRDLGLSVAEFGDECHFYAQAIRVMSNPRCDRSSVVILAEPSAAVIRDLKTLHSCSPRTAIVLVDGREEPELERGLGAARLMCERPSREELRHAIDAAVAAFGSTPERLRAPSCAGAAPSSRTAPPSAGS